jgi:hypothetical protein
MLFPEANRQTIANALVYLAKAGLIQDSVPASLGAAGRL